MLVNASGIELPSGHWSLVSHAKHLTDLTLEACGHPP